MKKTSKERKLQELDKRVRKAEVFCVIAEKSRLKARQARKFYFDKHFRCEDKIEVEHVGSHRFDLTHRCEKLKGHEGRHNGDGETWPA